MSLNLLRRPVRLIDKSPEIIIRRRKANGKFFEGSYVEGTEQVWSTSINIQPMTERERLLLPEGERQREQRVMYCATKLEIDDRVEHCGRIYEVHSVGAWGPYFRAVGRLKDV